MLSFDPADPQRFVWLEKAAVLGEYGWFLGGMEEQMLKFNAGNGFANVVFVIGMLKGHFDKAKRKMFVKLASFDTYIDPASQALHFYDFQLQSYRKAVDTWTIIGEKQGCEGYSKDDCNDNLGCERRSSFQTQLKDGNEMKIIVYAWRKNEQ
jgi:hypothetical protein